MTQARGALGRDPFQRRKNPAAAEPELAAVPPPRPASPPAVGTAAPPSPPAPMGDVAAEPTPAREEAPLPPPPAGFLLDYLRRRTAVRVPGDAAPPAGDSAFQAAARPFLDFLYRAYWRVTLEGLEHVPAAGGALLVVNHGGCLPLDAVMLAHGVARAHPQRRTVRPLVEDGFFHVPGLGPLLARLGAGPVPGSDAGALLAAGELVAVFPEGAAGLGQPWWRRYQLTRFGRGGFAQVARRARVPVIPVAIVGAQDVHPVLCRGSWLAERVGLPCLPVTPTFPWLGPLGLLPLPAKWTIRVGAPLALPPRRRGEDEPAVMQGFADTVRDHVQAMVDQVRTGIPG